MTGAALPSPVRGGFVTGFALSGFFDGVLLHQILQWHHVLSLVEDSRVQPLRVQILADGLFHAMMYVVAVAGLFMLWRSRNDLSAPGGSRRLWGGMLVGFGAWNIVDIGLVHWILRLHRLRLDVADPLLWDAGWLVMLGIAPVVAGALVLGRRRQGGGGDRRHTLLACVMLVGAGGWALNPPPANGEIAVLFRPGADVFRAAILTDSRVVQIDATGTVAIFRMADDASPWNLYGHGAVVVQGAGPAGCLSWTRPGRAESGNAPASGKRPAVP